MHGAGNDYLYIDCTATPAPDNLPELAREMSDRHFGAGGDGIILILLSDKADFRMRMFNADGSEAQMCGNGIRCVGKYVYDSGYTGGRTVFSVETLGGIKILDIHPGANGEAETVTVDMGEPRTLCAEIPVVPQGDDDTFINKAVATSRGQVEVTAVSMGNPHGVVFTDGELTDDLIHVLGREMETLPCWPERANMEFARVTGPDIEMRVWERGSGETLACGTGACATLVAAALTGRTGRHARLHLLGGTLDIEWRESDGHVMMTGPAATVASGVYFRR